MNLALSTIILFILLLPGIFFRKFYYSEEFSKEYFKQTFLEIFLSAFIPSLIFQSLWFFGIRLIGFQIDLQFFGNLLSNSPNPESYRHIELNAVSIFTYHFSMWVMAAVMGHFTKQIVRVKKWDKKYKQLRFQNSWHYILKGEFFDFPRSAFDLEIDTVEKIEIVYVDAMVQVQEGSILYDGILVDYELTKEGGLETITLKEVQRRFLKNDNPPDLENESQYYTIPGHILILKYSEIVNLNFSYYKMVQIENGTFNIELVK